MSKAMKHTHMYYFSTKDEKWYCGKDGCGLAKKEAPFAKTGICWECGNEMTLTFSTMKTAFPRHVNCNPVESDGVILGRILSRRNMKSRD